MKDLFSFLNNASDTSDFKAKLSERGGFITFSNSGRRGGIKFFQIGLDNILQTLKDILNHIEVFKNLTEYEETPWRNNGSEYFTDPVANANSTVQTKPLFSTLSKVVMWANQPKLDDIDSDTEICLDKEAIEITIAKLEDVADSFKPLKKSLNIADDNSHGYSISNRNGPNYDCSSFVFYSLVNAGILDASQGPFNTTNMGSVLTAAGFEQIPYDRNSLQAGDIVVDPRPGVSGHTTTIYSNENGEIKEIAAHYDMDGRSGDSSGNEISIASYSEGRHNYQYIYTYEKRR